MRITKGKEVQWIKVVITDDPSEDLVNYLKVVIDEYTNAEFGKATAEPLSDKVNSAIVIMVTCEIRTADVIKKFIDTILPGRCLFIYENDQIF